MDAVEYSESSTVTLEWTVKGLKNLFDQSKGELKSKVCKSVKFGGGRWQVLFYPNSGHEGGFVSLYLSCEPTEEEKERAVDAKWVREGLYKFSFELRNVNRGHLSPPKEACDHAFSYKTANWGWAQFAKRDTVFYNSNIVRHVDALLIICNITSSPAPPSPIPPVPTKAVPRSLMDAVGSMLNDPMYSDVEFVLPSRRKNGRARPSRSIFAAKRILQRVEYFELMFSSGFAEAIASPAPSTIHPHPNALADNISISVVDEQEFEDQEGYESSVYDDSDQSEPELDEGNIDDTPQASPPRSYKPFSAVGSPTSPRHRPQRDSMLSFMSGTTGTAVNSIAPYDPANEGDSLRQDSASADLSAPSADVEAENGIIVVELPESAHTSPRFGRSPNASPRASAASAAVSVQEPGSSSYVVEPYPPRQSPRIADHSSPELTSTPRPGSSGSRHSSGKHSPVRNSPGARTPPKLVSSKPGSPAHREVAPLRMPAEPPMPVPGPRKTKVVVKECEYATYYAVLYYLYTDSIVFCPLTSDFLTRTSSSLTPTSPGGTHGVSGNVPVSRSSPNALSLTTRASGSFAGSSSTGFYTASPFAASSFPSSLNPAGNPISRSQSHSRHNSISATMLAGQQQQQQQPAYQSSNPYGPELGEAVHRSRSEWVRAWMAANPGRPAPCSAKACYRLADKLGLTELRARAFQHIVKSLTVSNVPYEIFSSFSATFEEVRKVQVDFFLANWSEIKSSDAMRNVFQQIRLGRHPGFEEVWPLIIMNLEYNPRPANETNADGTREVGM